MTTTKLQALLIRQLEDLYSAEQQLLKVMFLFSAAAKQPELRQALLHYQFQSRGQLENLDQIFQLLHLIPHHRKCFGIHYLIEEGRELLNEGLDIACGDVIWIGIMQRFLYYKLAAYRAVHRCAECLGYPVVAQLLHRMATAEAEANETLDELAFKQLGVAEQYNSG